MMKIEGIGTGNLNNTLEQANLSKQTAQTTAFSEKLQQECNKLATSGTQKSEQEQLKLKKTCQDMESVFINLMLSNMRNTVQRSELLPESTGEKIMRSMLDQEMATKMSKAGGIGLAQLLYEQLTTETKKSVQLEK